MAQAFSAIIGSSLLANQFNEFASLLASPRETWDATRNQAFWPDFFEAGPSAVSTLYVPAAPAGRFLPLLAVPPELRTGHGERMIFSELAIEWMGMLLCSDLLEPATLPTLNGLRGRLRTIIEEIRELYLDRGNLPTLFTEDLLNRVFERRAKMAVRDERGPISLPVVRVHVNLTTANKIDDSKGLVGTALLTATREWLRENFGAQNTYMDPVRTAFLVILDDGVAFEDAAVTLNRFGPEVAERIREDESLQGTVPPERIEQFMPRHVALGLEFVAEDVPNIRGQGVQRSTITRVQSEVLSEIEMFRKLIAASTNYLDDHAAQDVNGPNLPLYTTVHLPSENDAVYRRYLDNLAGFMGDGVFGVENGSPDGRVVKEHPRHRHSFGQLSRLADMGGGGVFEGFERWLETFEQMSRNNTFSADDRDPLLRFFLPDGANIGNGLRLLLKIGEDATRVPNYPSLFKPLQNWRNGPGEIENANVFAERVAAAGYRQFVVFEYDSYKDFRKQYAPKDDVDSEFQGIRKFWFDVAEEMGLPEPIVTPFQGDLVLLATQGGSRLREYIDRVRERVRATYADRPFQRSTKFTQERFEPLLGRKAPHTVRLPLWVKEGLYHMGPDWPGRGYQPYEGTLTISGTYFSLPAAIRRQDQGRALFQIAENAGKFIDETAKYLGGEARLANRSRIALAKDGWAELPIDQWPEPLGG